MCGILGLFDSEKKLNGRWAQQFIAGARQIKHRGPDGYGFWTQSHNDTIFNSDDKSTEEYLLHQQNTNSLWLAHRRLSIIDLSKSGDQPITVITKQGKKLVITYNGEIYNYIELRKELEAEGHQFHTATDTEVLLRAYEQWGTNAFNKFNGMWAFAIWDEALNKLILSRDRFGVKPLHYTFINKCLIFSSEIKQLINFRKTFSNDTQPWNTYRIAQFLNQAQLHNGEETFFNNIYNLRPAHFIQINLTSNNPHESLIQIPYWDYPDESQCHDSKNITFEEAAKQLRSLLTSSVIFRLRSDVPVGSALSGGLDSSSIVQLVSEITKKSQKTFTAAYKGHPEIDETSYTKLLTQNKGLEAHIIYPTKDGLARDLEDLCYHLDGPFQSASMYSQRTVFEKSHNEHIKVMLDGQGADEVLAGYEGFYKSWAKSLVQTNQLFNLASGTINFSHSNQGYFKKVFRNKMGKLHKSFLNDSANKEYLLKAEELNKIGDKSLFGKLGIKYSSPFKEALYRSTVSSSLPTLLHYEDRNSMTFSIESRTPFLDYRLVEFAFKCPTDYHFMNGTRKSLLKEAVKGLIPEEIRMRKDKIGFDTPEMEWTQPLANKLSNLNTFAPNILDLSNWNSISQSLYKREHWRLMTVALSNKIFFNN